MNYQDLATKFMESFGENHLFPSLQQTIAIRKFAGFLQEHAAQQSAHPTGCYACDQGIIRCDGIAVNCPVCNPATSG